MPQNRGVAGATMGPGRRAGAATFGGWGYLTLSVPVASLAVFFWLIVGPADPLGLRWGWFALLLVLAVSATSRVAGRRGAATEARWRSAPRTAAYWTQRTAPWAVLGVILVGLAAQFAGAGALAAVMIVTACVATAAVAPAFLRRPPAAPAGEGTG